jgi:iron complex outermembrane receptor protein
VPGKTRTLSAASLAATVLAAGISRAAAPDYTEMSLEQLMDVEVTSVSRRPQKASEAAAAVFVLTREDIRRAGVTSVPDALRLVPGVEVARISTNTWAISIRGFNSRFANKLLVMIDGRSVYTPLFSGVFWDHHDVLLEDVDRIEVVRGPGASLWGANAVNGVINIITRHTKDTQGTFARGTAGNVEQGIAEVRHGGRIDAATYRLYAKGRIRESGETEAGANAGDDWKVGLVGFRGDTEAGADSFLLEGQYQWSEASERASVITLTPPFADTGNLDNNSNGGYLLGRWSRELSDESSLSVQGYYDHRQFDDVRLSERRDTFDLQLQHNFSPLPHHEVVWGAGYRLVTDGIDNTFSVSFDPESRTTHLFSSFVQDTFTLLEDELDLVVGTKLEHNDFTGFEVQPNARLLWRPAAPRRR